MGYALLADLIVAVHLAIVIYVLAGELLIVVGGLRRWSWIRNPIFRLSHLVVIAYVALQGVADTLCPLTVWEDQLRVRAGEEGRTGTFIGRLMHDLLFLDVEQRTLNRVYVAFALLVVFTLFLWPPRWRLRKLPGAAR
jgi:uncharacterized protein DUF2784